MGKIVKYIHHGAEVFVDEDQKGTHRNHCLCFRCKLLNTEDREKNCWIARQLFDFCIANDMVTPVFECPIFQEK